MFWRPAAIGFLTVSISACGGGGGSDAANPLAPVVNLGAAPAAIVAGTAATLSWDTADADDCSASGGWTGSRSTSGSESTGTLTATTSFTLTCNGAGGTTAETTTVNVTAPATPTVTLAANPSSVTSGTAATLTWNSANVSSCTASGGWSGAKATSGSQAISNLATTTTFNLTCTGAGGSASQSVTITVTPPPPQPILSLAANPATVVSGASSTLSWSATNATTCTASGGWSGTKATSGTQATGNLTANTTYTLACTGPGGSASQSTTVTVLPPPVVTLAANPTSLVSGASSALSWNTTNATNCTASGGWSGTKPTSGSQATGNLTATTTYTLTCSGAGGVAADTITVTVTAPGAPTVTLSANPTDVASGSAATLTWSTTNATTCTASGGWSGTRATSGTQSTSSLTASTTYTLTCTGPGGSGAQSATVTILPAPTVTLAASPTSVVSGASSTLTWNTTNATACTASGGWSGSKATSGTQSTGNLTTTTAYTLNCTGPGGSASQSATVTVLPAPTVTLAASPTSVLSGASSTLTWNTTDATTCAASGGWSGSKATSGTQSTSSLTASTTYTLTCTGPGGSAAQSATVNILPAPTVTLAASPTSVLSGASSTLTWNTTDATACTASGGWSGTKATSGTQSTGNLTTTTAYTLNCTGPGGSANGSVTVIVTTTGSVFPLRTEAGKRYLVTAQGDPFLMHGDTPWTLITQLTREEADQYLEDRQQKGFNTILVELIEIFFSVNAPANIYGDAPFTTPGDFSTPNEAYFAHAEYVIAKAREKGMLVLLTPAYLGFNGGEKGWYDAMIAAGTTELRGYGQYLATRFAAYDNIMWVHGGDYNPPSRGVMRAIVEGILDVEQTSLHTFHGSRGTAALDWLGPTETWLDVNDIYTTKDTVVAEARGEYERATMPFFLIENYYEGEFSTIPTDTRAQAWQAVLSGATGQLMGQADIWPFTPGVWPGKLDTEGASTMVHLRTLLEDFAWWTLEPDFDNLFLTSDPGSGVGRAVAAVAADQTFALLYTRNIRTLTVDVGALDGTAVRARWYDPTNGSFASIPGSPFAPAGTVDFTPTGNNSRGRTDWVLVLDAIP